MQLSFGAFGMVAGVIAAVLLYITVSSWREIFGRFAREEKVTAAFVSCVGLFMSLPTFVSGLLNQRRLVVNSNGILISDSDTSRVVLAPYSQLLLLFICIVVIGANLRRRSSQITVYPRPLVALLIGTATLCSVALAQERVFTLANVLFIMVLLCCCTLVPTVAAVHGAAIFGLGVAVLSGLTAVVHPDQTMVDCERKCSTFGVVYYGLYLHENAIGLVLALTIGTSFLLFTGLRRVIVISSLLIMVVATGSRTSIAAAAITVSVGVLFIYGADSKRVANGDGEGLPARVRFVRTMIAGAIMCWPLVMLFSNYANDLTGRPLLWKIALDSFQSNPIIGWGASHWASISYSGSFDGAGRYSAHNQALDVMFVGGLVGLLGFGYLVITALWSRNPRTALYGLSLLLPVCVLGFAERAMAIGSLDWLSYSYVALIALCGGSFKYAADTSRYVKLPVAGSKVVVG